MSLQQFNSKFCPGIALCNSALIRPPTAVNVLPVPDYRLLGMSKCETGNKIPFDTSYRLVEGVLEEKNVLLTPSQIRSAINALHVTDQNDIIG